MNLNGYLNVRSALVFLLVAFFALISGVVASTGQALFVTILSGVFLAFLFLSKPLSLFFIVSITTLVLAGSVLYFVPGFNRIWWVAYGMAGLLFIPAILGFFQKRVERRVHPKSLPLYVPLILFCFVILFSLIISPPPLFQAIIFIKNILLFGAVWAFLAFYPISDKVIKQWLILMLAIAILQVFPVLYQYVFVRSERLLMGIGLVEASDSVVGTFGGSQEGGGLTAVLGFYLVVVLVVMLAFIKDKVLSKRQFFILLPFIVIPLLLIEVKAIFVFIPIGLLVLYRREIVKHPFKALLWFVILVFCLILVLLSYQFLHWGITGKDFFESISHTFQYTFEESTTAERLLTGEISRRQAYEIWWMAHRTEYGVEALIGHGLGASKSSGIVLGEIAKIYAPLEIDMVGVVMLLWDIGILGVMFVSLMFLVMYKKAGIATKSIHLEPWKRSLARALQAIIVLFFVYVFYRNDLPNAAPMMFLLMSSFGLISWLNVEKEPVACEKRI